jgi:hypothetical protein
MRRAYFLSHGTPTFCNQTTAPDTSQSPSRNRATNANMPPTSLCQQGTQSSLLKGPCTRSFNRSTFLGMHFQILVYDSNHMRTVKVLICWVGRRRAFLKNK